MQYAYRQVSLRGQARGTQPWRRPAYFNTITVSDGISMGHGGMLFSLPSREAIADSIEIVTGAERFDGLVAIGGCDKNTPACLMAIGRMNIPAVYVYGVPSNPGNSKARTWISLRLLKRSGNITMEKCQTSDSIRLSALSARDRAPVVACTQPIRWPRGRSHGDEPARVIFHTGYFT